MKKTLGLVLALVMILTAVSAFAAIPSKTTSDLVTVKVQPEGADVTVSVTDNESEAVVELLKSLMEDPSIPAEAAAELPEGSTFTTVVEAVTMKIEGGTAEGDLILNLKFPTDFSGKTVAVLLGLLVNDEISGWKCLVGEGQDDGSVNVTLNGEMQDWLGGHEFIALVAE